MVRKLEKFGKHWLIRKRERNFFVIGIFILRSLCGKKTLRLYIEYVGFGPALVLWVSIDGTVHFYSKYNTEAEELISEAFTARLTIRTYDFMTVC